MSNIRIARAVGSQIDDLNKILKKKTVKYVDLKLGRMQDGNGRVDDVWILLYEETSMFVSRR